MGLFDFLKKKETIPYEKIAEQLDVFTKESLAMPKMNNPFLLDDKTKHPMLFGYFMGAMEYLTQAYRLNEKDTDAIYTKYLSRNFADHDEEQTRELFNYSKEISQAEHVSRYMVVGNLAMKKWEAGGPMAKYAPMGLIRLLND
ncbi:MAG TPA: hypothetical protein VIM88_04415 [Sulfurovum sp.]|uniref:hypothetical protein n=1 Tax=Sulfurovum sp. TaxID=1969726 RepID=UPI002F948256